MDCSKQSIEKRLTNLERAFTYLVIFFIGYFSSMILCKVVELFYS